LRKENIKIKEQLDDALKQIDLEKNQNQIDINKLNEENKIALRLFKNKKKKF
jgi:GH25 family lysozyme M1 (1,4-beta-N-acetylmuramidase)